MIRTIILCLGNVMPIEKNRLWLNQEIAKKTGLDRVAISRYLELLEDIGIVNSFNFGNRTLYGLDNYFKNKMCKKGEDWIKEFIATSKHQNETTNMS